MAYDPEFEKWWDKYYYNLPPSSISYKEIAYFAWRAGGHKEFIDKIDKDLKINDAL